jgi:epoxyqueuosine reductase
MARRETGETGVEPVAALSLKTLQTQLDPHFLEILGGFACEDDRDLPAGTRALLLIGPKEPGYWAHVQSQPEWGGADPVDKWSRRVIGKMACDLGGKAFFPFGGAPFHPFYQWALRTGQVWDSPVKLLIHARQGLMVSFRGALALKQTVDLPSPTAQPCNTCDKPCLTACPVGALTDKGYDLEVCHGHLDEPVGGDCMNGGCLVRRACPVSATYARIPEHSAYHMRQFHRAG